MECPKCKQQVEQLIPVDKDDFVEERPDHICREICKDCVRG